MLGYDSDTCPRGYPEIVTEDIPGYLEKAEYLGWRPVHRRTGTLCTLTVVIDPDEMARWGEGVPGDVEPAAAGEELVGELPGLEEIDQALELGRVFGTDVGGLAEEVLGVADTTDLAVHGVRTEPGIDDDGADDDPGRL